MRLIDADELLTAFPVDDEPMLTKSCVRMTIQHMPTIEPEQPQIIHCKDCKCFDTHGKRCKVWNHGISENEFCSRGERK